MANTFQEVFIDCKRNIQIPLLQRDYVQGGRESVIVPFLEQLVSAVLNEDCTVNLNYIYGYEEKDGFIPIDGQQRLITLWLLHLYIYSQQSLVFPVDLEFESREFADAFSKKLKEKLSDALKLTGVKLKDYIVDSPWFVTGWLYDATVANMLEALNKIHEIIGGIPASDIYTQNISFDFLNIKEVGLDDDVYVKMNGRGRPLTYFENLKSWMDEQVKTLFGEDDQFTKDWRTKMDNDWSELFWNNRNTKQEHPEEIDDEQLRFFYSMLLLFWKKNDIGFCSNESDETRRKVLKTLLECKELISLYQIHKFALFNREVFRFISESLDVLREISIYVNKKLDERITKILGFDSSETTLLYKIALKEATYEKTLPLLYAITKTPVVYRNENTFFRWMRLWSNLILNSDIRNDNIKKACATIDLVSENIVDDNLYNVVSALLWKDGIGFAKEQFNEERTKAKQIIEGEPRADGKSWEETIINAENHAFFKGAVRFLFTGEDGSENWVDFDKKLRYAKEYFPSDCSDEYPNTIELAKYFEDNDVKSLWHYYSFEKKENTWRTLLLSKQHKQIHGFLMKLPVPRKSVLIEDLENLISEINSSLWLRNWYTENCFLTNYDKQVSVPENGFVYMVGERPRNRVIIELEQLSQDIKFRGGYPDSCRKEVNGLYYYRGLQVDFKYEGHCFRLWENNTVCLMSDEWTDKIYKNKDNIDDVENTYYFKINEETERNVQSHLDKILEEASK